MAAKEKYREVIQTLYKKICICDQNPFLKKEHRLSINESTVYYYENNKHKPLPTTLKKLTGLKILK